MKLLDRLAGLFGARRQDSVVTPEPIRPTERETPTASDAERTVRQICSEALFARRDWRANLGDSRRWAGLKEQAPELQVAVLMMALDRKVSYHPPFLGERWHVDELQKAIVSNLLRRNLPLTEKQLLKMLGAWLEQPSLENGVPGLNLLTAVERHAAGAPLTPSLSKALGRVRVRANRAPDRFSQTVLSRVDGLLAARDEEVLELPRGAFAKDLKAWLATLPDADRAAWQAVLGVAAQAGEKTAPTRKWLAAARVAADSVGRAQLTKQILAWIEECTPDPKKPDISLDVLKGLVWLTSVLDPSEAVGPVGRFAERCFRKVPGVGARSVRLGNAALWALSDMAGEPRAAAELFRLRERVKTPSARKVVASRLADLAGKGGQSVQDMEDGALPDFGLDAGGRATFGFGAARAELTLHADRVDARWFAAGDRAVKSVPADVRAHHADSLAECRRRIKELEDARAGQASRLEQGWLEERDWSVAAWTERLLGHPVRRVLVESLIWWADGAALMSVGGVFIDVEGRPRDIAPDARIRLWHPLDSHPDEVLAWRRRIVDLGLTQPIKQAHREIYVLTEAEERTRTYSNRFAAHILRQHQFRALCQARGWTYDLMGAWDSWNVPTRVLPRQGLSVQYEVDLVDDGRHTEAGVSLHLASDQVRFLDSYGRQVPLDEIPVIVFSEVLRDVDLFVAVTSVANDPRWTDGGPDGRHGVYWEQWAFGDLGQGAATRRELIAMIAPRLSIADKLTVTDKFLVVTGKRHEYAIHFGSGNIQIRPGNRYLCIVPDRDPAEAAGLRLPFTGDGVLSTILAKAFLLVDEDKITDRTILSQL